jgi:hypothetical protein
MAIIIISSEIGTPRDEIAALVAKKLDHQLADHSHVRQLAQDCDSEFDKACAFYQSNYGEQEHVGWLERVFYSKPAYVSLFKALHYELASRGDVVILGRGPQIVLRDVPGVLKVRIVAPTRWRAEKMAARRNISLDEATAYVDKMDLSRRALMESVYGVPIYIWLYDLSINVQTFTVETAAGFICQAASGMDTVPDEADLKEKLTCLALAARVDSAIKQEIQVAPFREFEVSATADGQVSLEGAVHERYSKTRAEKIARTVKGVSGVVNRLKTTDLGY